MAEPSSSSSSSLPIESLKFDQFCQLCDLIAKTKSERRKKALESVWMSYYKQNIFSLMRLLLPKLDDERGGYGIKEKGLGTMFIEVLGISKDSSDGKAIVNYRNPAFAKGTAGDIVSVIETVTTSRLPSRKLPGKTDLSIGEVNQLLDELFMADSKDRRKVFLKIINTMCGREVFWFCRIILKDMKMGMSKDTILKLFHPNALELYNTTSSLKKVCEVVLDPKRVKKELNRLRVFTPCIPMLAARKDWRQIVTSMRGSEFGIEPKYDGIRLHIHKQGSEMRLFTRGSVEYTSRYGYGVALEDLVLKSLDCDSCIVDGELVAWDPDKKIFKPFGTNRSVAQYEANQIKMNKSKALPPKFKEGDWLCPVCEFHNFRSKSKCFECNALKPAQTSNMFEGKDLKKTDEVKEPTEEQRGQLCYQAFDILMLNGESLLDFPLRERRRMLRRIIIPTEKRFELIEQRLGAVTTENVMGIMDEFLTGNMEGIIIKNLDSKYICGDRSDHWLKLKPDHVVGMLDNIDLVILGGYYGEGTHGRAGRISHFLLGLRGRPRNMAGLADVKHNRMLGRDGSYPDYDQPAPRLEVDSLEKDENSKLFTVFCKCGTGYTHEELRELRERLDLVPARARTLPPYILPDTVLEPDDRPDVWVRDPEKSVVMELIVYEILECRWDKFRAKFTTRFPRCNLIRYDKPVSQCMTWTQMYQYFLDVRQNRGGRCNRAVDAMFHEENSRGRGRQQMQNRRKKRRVAAVGELHQATDVTDVKVESRIFVEDGLPLHFCILSVDQGVEKSDLEREIKRHGGAFSQNPLETTTYILAGPQTLRVRTQVLKGEHDIIHHSWLMDCVKAGRRLPLELKHIINVTEETRTELEERMDVYGDDYTKDTTLVGLKDVLLRIPANKKTESDRREAKTENKTKGGHFHLPSLLRRNISEEEANATILRHSMFNQCVVYLDMYAHHGRESSFIPHSRLRTIEAKILVYGGRVAKSVSPGVTHVILDESNNHLSKTCGALSIRKNTMMLFKKMRQEGYHQKPRFVSAEWVEACIAAGELKREEEFPPKWR